MITVVSGGMRDEVGGGVRCEMVSWRGREKRREMCSGVRREERRKEEK